MSKDHSFSGSEFIVFAGLFLHRMSVAEKRHDSSMTTVSSHSTSYPLLLKYIAIFIWT